MDAGACAQGSLDVSAAVMMSIGDILGSGVRLLLPPLPDPPSARAYLSSATSEIAITQVFASPGIVLANVHSPGAALASWLAGGIISFTGLLCLVELVVHSPDAGGVYAYLRMAFGDAFGFSWQFINFWCCVPGALAAQALTFAQYLASFIPSARSESALSGDLNAPPPLSVKLIAFACISAVTAINCFSATIGGSAAKALTSLAMAGCILVVLLGAYAVFLPEPEDRTSWHHNLHDQPLGPTNLAGFGPAVISALWAFSGWADIAALAEELKEPKKNMPKVSGIALLTITITYVLMNAAYIAVVPAEQLAHESALGVTFAQIASGKQWPGLLVAAFVSASTMSSLHNNLFLSAVCTLPLFHSFQFISHTVWYRRKIDGLTACTCSACYASLYRDNSGPQREMDCFRAS